jgi:hypothetical protein
MLGEYSSLIAKTRFQCPIHPYELGVDKEWVYLTRSTYLRGGLIEPLW